MFYFDTNLGREWEPFWDSIWRKASEVLVRSDRIAICGYGMPEIDERGRELLLKGSLTAAIEVCCGSDTDRGVQQLRGHGRQANAASEVFFEHWVASNVLCG